MKVRAFISVAVILGSAGAMLAIFDRPRAPLAPASGSIILKVAATPAHQAEMYRAIVTGFERQNPDIKVALDLSQSDQTAMVQKTMRQSLAGLLPDVSFQGYNYLRLLDERNLVVRLDRGTAAPIAAAATEQARLLGTVDGHVVGLGVAMAVPIVIYNESLVSFASDTPLTWPIVLRAAEQVQQRDPATIPIFARYNAFIFQGLVRSASGQMADAQTGRPTLNQAEARATLKLLARIGRLGQAEYDMSRGQVRQAFTGGKIAILIDSSSSVGGLSRDVAEQFGIGTAPLPVSGSNPSVPASGAAVVLMTRDKARQTAALRFIRYVTSAEARTTVAKLSSYLPPGATESATDLERYYRTHKTMAATFKSARYAGPWYAYRGANAARIDRVLEDELGLVLTLKRQPDATANALQRQVTNLVNIGQQRLTTNANPL